MVIATSFNNCLLLPFFPQLLSSATLRNLIYIVYLLYIWRTAEKTIDFSLY